PTIFSDVTNSMRIAQEEIFGPVLCVMKFSTIEEAIKIANDSKFGLAACVWTKDDNKAQSVARQLQCGTVWINTYGGFYNEAPFGGYKRSGFGRELGVEGLLEYTQTKHICIDQTPGGKPLVSGWF
ncbi:MAG TPA: aldehyde dehydrogenase family protein, partial [Candidatus Omnitrophota bacterium]|nr:aldehyde dehydrogenase family protein [Candidatus Omnitrophota bacterium]